MRVAIQGTHGSFSEAAARRRWPDLETLPCREAKDVVAAVREGTGGGRLPPDRELPHRIGHHHLRPARRGVRRRHAPADARDSLPGAPHADGGTRARRSPASSGCSPIRSRWGSAVYGSAQHLPDAELVSAWDTGGSAEIVAQERNPTLAAIAARQAADAHGLVALAERIEDDPTNQTRFLTFTRAELALQRSAQRGHAATRPRSSC